MNKLLLAPMIFSAVTVLWGDICLAIPHPLESYHLARGEFIRVYIPVTVIGLYTLSVSASEGDADIYVYQPSGERIGVGDQVGDDSLTGNLAAGIYTIGIHMASCTMRSGSCTANLTVAPTGNLR